MQCLKNHVQTLNPKFEDGFLCQHCKKLWLKLIKLQEGYEKAMKLLGSRVIKYSRWLQFVQFLYPEISLVRPRKMSVMAAMQLTLSSQIQTSLQSGMLSLKIYKQLISVQLSSNTEQCRRSENLMCTRCSPILYYQKLCLQIILPDFNQEVTVRDSKCCSGKVLISSAVCC